MTRIDTENRSPFPIPFGWFQIGWGGDLKPGEVKPLEYFGRHLALWRDDNGVAAQLGALPAPGSPPAYGGTVHGEELTCPFHGWRFTADGRNSHIPTRSGSTRRHVSTPSRSSSATVC
ncbi:MAG: Rieske 2Fe-2S domain-containing protein [Microthrixaceae bacterium]